MSPARAASERTCIGCRRRDAPVDLLRVVLVDGVVTPDPRAIRPGRGAWVHPACSEEAERRKAFTRALRTAGALDLSVLREYVAHKSTSGGHTQVTAVHHDRRRDGASEDEPPMSAQP